MDNLISADLVTADGEFLTCDADRDAELFWALRGGGGNFGVVTSFEYRLHPVADVLGGPTFYPLDGEVMRGYRRLIADAPDELGAILGITLAPRSRSSASTGTAGPPASCSPASAGPRAPTPRFGPGSPPSAR